MTTAALNCLSAGPNVTRGRLLVTTATLSVVSMPVNNISSAASGSQTTAAASAAAGAIASSRHIHGRKVRCVQEMVKFCRPLYKTTARTHPVRSTHDPRNHTQRADKSLKGTLSSSQSWDVFMFLHFYEYEKKKTHTPQTNQCTDNNRLPGA